MKKFGLLLVLVFVLVIVLPASSAFAASPSERDCEGIFDRDHGTVSCVVEDPVGNSENSDGHSQTVEEEESSQGTFNNAPHHKDSCTGPGNSGEDGGPCPKG